MLDKQKDLNSLRNNVTEIQEANFVCRLIGMIVYDNLKIAIQILDRISIEEKCFFLLKDKLLYSIIWKSRTKLSVVKVLK